MHRLPPGGDVKLFEDVHEVSLHRGFRNEQRIGDLAVRCPGGKEREHLAFPGREPGPVRTHPRHHPGRMSGLRCTLPEAAAWIARVICSGGSSLSTYPSAPASIAPRSSESRS